LKNDKDVVYKAVSTNPTSLKFAHERFRTTKDIVYDLVSKYDYYTLDYVDEAFKDDKELVLTAIEKSGDAIKFSSKRLKNDKELALKALKNGQGDILYYLSDTLKEDRDVVWMASKVGIDSYSYLDEKFCTDTELLKEIVKKSPHFFHTLPVKYRTVRVAKDVIIEAIKSRSYQIELEPLVLKEPTWLRNREIAGALIAYNSGYFKLLNETFKVDKELLLQAIKSNVSLFSYIDESFKNDKDFILDIAKTQHKVIPYISEILRKDDAFMLKLFQTNQLAFQYLEEKYRGDKKLLLKAIEYRVHLFRYATKELRVDKEFILSISTKLGVAIDFIDTKLKKDREFLDEVLKSNLYALRYYEGEFLKNYIKDNVKYMKYLTKRQINLLKV